MMYCSTIKKTDRIVITFLRNPIKKIQLIFDSFSTFSSVKTRWRIYRSVATNDFL